jgi:predicted transcriptional regulator of viral defense system
MALASTYRRTLRERALEQYGYVTTRNAEELGVPAVELRKLASRGGIEHVGHGLYRFEDVPHTGKEQFMEAVLRVGPDAYLTGDAVLAFHDLALVNPRRLRVAAPHRPRRKLPEFIEVVPDTAPASERTRYEGIAATTVARALRDCRGMVVPHRLLDAARDAARNGLLRRKEAAELINELGKDVGQ